MIGVGYCTITAASETEIVCITDTAEVCADESGTIIPTNTGSDDEPILELAMMGRIVEEATCQLDECLFYFYSSQTPEITDISDNDSLTYGTTVTVSGTFDTGDLKDVFDDLTAEIDVDEITIIIDDDGTGFTFEFPELEYGYYELSLTHATYGYAINDIYMLSTLNIDSISPTTGSSYSTRLTISGNGFLDGVVINFGTDGDVCNIYS